MANNATVALTETGLGAFIGGAETYNLVRMVGLQGAIGIVYTEPSSMEKERWNLA